MRRIINIQANGSKNYQLWSGDLGPSPVTILEYPPYFLVFGSEAMLPTDVAFRAPRIENYDEENNLVTCVLTAKYLDSLRKYYNHNIQERSFVVDDMVLRRRQKTDGMHKLSSPWEGPYIIKAVT